MYLIISTIPHLFSIIPLIKYYNTYTFGYINIIVLSTIFSILYHLTKESNIIIIYFDYLCAFIWCLYDLYFGYILNNFVLYNIIFGNSVVFIINIIIPYDNNYTLYHTIWHIINSCKCLYISLLINYNICNFTKYHDRRWS
jgi:hypothetical protein